MEELVKVFTHFTEETLYVVVSAFFFFAIIFAAYWFYNRRKFHKLSHQIPASVVKSYLDSIIQNSTSLKSSLFRGGGLDIGDGIPSVKPMADVVGSGSVSVAGVSSEELNQKNAEIASLNSQLSEKLNLIKDLEKSIEELKANSGGSASDDEALQAKIKELEVEIESLKKQLEEAKSSGGEGGADPQASAKLEEVTKERDELKERLMEYEIIEDDLANLKRLQQENEQLKASLAAGGGAAAAAASAEPAAEAPAQEAAPEPEAPVEEPAAEQVAAPEPEPVAPAQEAAPEEAAPVEAPAAEAEAPAQEAASEEEAPEVEEDGKSAEDLLSEFEKMLG